MPARIVALCIVAAIGLSRTAAAMDAQGQFGIRGAGLVSCAVYNHERKLRSKAYDVIAGWMDGYLTGVNQYAAHTFDAAPFESTELYAALVSEYCRKHPDVPVFTVLNSLVRHTWKDRLHSASSKGVIRVGKQTTHLYKALVWRIQRRLAKLGFYRQLITGTYGPAVVKAMKAYQKSIRFEPTGFPDQATLWRLFNVRR